jgi:predicted small metal-binding protein
MKKITCEELGGSCDFVLSAETCEGMVEEMWTHLKEKHPVRLTEIESNSRDEWRKAVRAEWDAAPRVEPAPTYPNLN